MDKGKVIALCIFVLVIMFIYTDQNKNEIIPTDNSTDKSTPRRGNPSSPIIIPPILNVSLYADENCTTERTNIDWGTLYAGSSKTETIYIKNTGNGDVKLTLFTADWVIKDDNDTILSSDYQQYINLTWNIEGIVIKPNEIVNATLRLTISPSIENAASFAFTIHIGWFKG